MVTVTLTCRSFGAPRPLVRWLRNNEELTEERFLVLENGDLKIHDINFSDEGNYICFASNKFGNDSAEASLLVKEHTRILERPNNYQVKAGTTVTFRCTAITDPTLDLQIDWLRNSEIIDFDIGQRFVKLKDNSLIIYKPTATDSGAYTCIARTEFDTDQAEGNLIIQDRPHPPKLLRIQCNKRNATVWWQPVGGNSRNRILHYSIQFNTSFTPDAWKNGSGIISATLNRYTILMSPWSNYTFRVIAHNKIGASDPSFHSETCNTRVDVPYKNPENVRGEGTTPNNLVISWALIPEIDHNAPELKYLVQWKPDDGQSEWNSEEVYNDWSVSEYVIENQPTYRPYLIRVGAANSVGESNSSPVHVQGYSGMDEPMEFPSNLTLIQKWDGDKVIVEWSPVSPLSLRGKFEGYKIKVWKENDTNDDLREIRVKNSVTRVAVQNLIPYSKNYLVVMAYNTQYNGPPSTPIEIEMPEGKPGPVDHFEGYPLGASAVYLIWRKPEQPNGVLKGYRIQYQTVDMTELGLLVDRIPQIENPDETRGKLAGLQPNRKYRVIIKAFTSVGSGSETFIELSTEVPNLNSPLRQPKFIWNHEHSENGRTAVRVKWIPDFETPSNSTSGSCPGSNFFVQYKLYDAAQYTRTALEFFEDFIIVRDLEPGQTYIFRVVAVDGTLTQASDIQEISIVDNSSSKLFTYIGIVSLVLVVIGSMIFGLGNWLRVRKANKLMRGLTEEEIEEFFNGLPQFGELNQENANCSENYNMMPYQQTYETEMEDTELDYNTVLGKGQFATVVKGYIKSKSLYVAVKIAKTKPNVDLFREMLTEVKILTYIGIHANVIGLVGANTQDIRNRSLYIYMDLCELGSLEKYLRKNKDNFTNLIDENKKLIPRLITSDDVYFSEVSFSSLDLIRWAAQIATGMEYLSNKSVVHMDLAARNVLLTREKTAKISDFGLSRQLYGANLYTKKTKCPLPWRWMALESLKTMEFSTESDVWSYGVTLWELFSLGDMPYPNENWIGLQDQLLCGLRLDKPEFCTQEIYAAMVPCWDISPSKRPHFQIFRIFFDELYDSLNPLGNQSPRDQRGSLFTPEECPGHCDVEVVSRTGRTKAVEKCESVTTVTSHSPRYSTLTHH